MPLLALVLSYVPFVVRGQETYIPSSGITSKDDVVLILANWLHWIFGFVGVLAIIVIIYSAVLFLTAGDDEGRRKSAKGWLLYGIIGIIVAILSYTIISIIGSFLNVNTQ